MATVARAGGLFERIHNELAGHTIDFASLDPAHWDAERLSHARVVWAERVASEFRSIQVMTRFTTEVLGAGDPLDVWSGAADAIMDEIRHTALCVGVLEALGGQPELPEPLVEAESAEFMALPMAERALATAVSMLAISETLSTGFIEDISRRCEQPAIAQVLRTTLADEDTHHAFGWGYVEASLSRFDASGLEFARMVTQTTLAPHLEQTEAALATIPLRRRHLGAWPEPELAELGLLSAQRQALVFQSTWQSVLAPRLTALGLLPD